MNSSVQVADQLRALNVQPVVSWSKTDALNRCVRSEKWSQDLPGVANVAVAHRKKATSDVTRMCHIFGHAHRWDPDLCAIPAHSSLKLPKSMGLVYKLRHMLEVILALKFSSHSGDVYDCHSCLRAIQQLTREGINQWRALLRALIRWAQSTMALLHVARKTMNMFVPEFLEPFRLCFVPVIHDLWENIFV